MTTRLYLTLEKSERQALGKLALEEMRDVREQARFIIRRDLEKRGYLSQEERQPVPAGRGGDRDDS